MNHSRRALGTGLATLLIAIASNQDLGSQAAPPVRGLTLELMLKSMDIKAKIVDGVATTTLRQVFYNPGHRVAEATWILPLPPNATADDFTMTMNGKQVRGEVLNHHSARRVYENIVRRRKDPGLLEYMGNGCLRARVFPILPKSNMKVEVRYRQVLPESSGIHEWSFPLRAANINGTPAEKINLDLQIQSKKSIKNVYSPTAGVDVMRKGENQARVSLELTGSRMPRRDLQVFYGISDKEFGLNLLTHRRDKQAGYFMMMLAPKITWDQSKMTPKCLNFVVDTSGSMNGKKIEQAKGALKFFVNSLQAHDYFNVIPFSTAARPFFPQPVQASAENIDKALKLAASIKARGGTNIEKGITTALKASIPMEDVALMEMTVFLTDGLPTVDTTNPARLLEIIKDSNKNKHRIFVFGVGNDVNTKLLDKIASQNRGARDYVREHEDIEVRTGALFTKLSHPVMSDVRIDCDGIDAFDVFPRDTPDLFKGSRLLLTGRYKATGSHAIRLTGTVNGEQKTYVYEASLPKTRLENDFLATLWAQRKVAVLLDNLRLNGHSDELVQEIRRIGGEHGIITPYTSHLILEEGQAVARHRLGWKVSRRPNLEQALTDRIQAPGAAAPATQDRVRKELLRSGEIDEVAAEAQISSLAKRVKDSRKAAKLRLQGFSGERGRAAVGNSAGLSRLSQSVAITKGDSAANLVTKNIQGHTFHLVQGVWIDRAFTAAMKDKIHKVKPFSDEYFKLTKRHPELARILAFSTRILVVIDGKAIEIS